MQVVVVAHNIRSTHNVGSIFRSCDGFGVNHLFLTGYTPYPALPPGDERPPHIRAKLTQQIHKTALGAEANLPHSHRAELEPLLRELTAQGYEIIALEQAPHSVPLPQFRPRGDKLALLLGEEVHGIPADVLERCDSIAEIPMSGRKESFNVSVAAGIALYSLLHVQ